MNYDVAIRHPEAFPPTIENRRSTSAMTEHDAGLLPEAML